MHIKIEMVPRSSKTSSKPLMNYSGHEASKHFLGWKRSHADFPIFTCAAAERLLLFFFTVIRRSFLWFHFHTYAAYWTPQHYVAIVEQGEWAVCEVKTQVFKKDLSIFVIRRFFLGHF